MKDTFSILIVEDDTISRIILEKNLIKAGRKVTTARNGKEALEILKKKYFPIVITDWMMPEMDGVELCRAIRAQKFSSYVFIILLTARTEKDDIIEGLDAGADDYLTKPFNQAELLARLRAGIRILKLYEEIKLLSITDPLTKCYNRGYLMENLTCELKRSERYRKDLQIVMSDLDNFKRINDTYGHQVGDLILKEYANLIKENIRDGIDWLARYGGEEFVLVLPETGKDGSWQVTERIHHLVSEMVIPVGSKTVKFTASFGIAGFDYNRHKGNMSIEALIEEADRNLYAAKEGGRNRVVGVT